MVIFFLLLLPLVVLSVIELWLVLTLAPVIGTAWTIVWLIASFFLGLVLLRIEGVIKLMRIHRMLLAEEIPTRDLMDLFLILIGAVMLILPGFLTDFLGLVLLVPPFRWGLRELMVVCLRRMLPAARGSSGPVRPGADTIEIFPEKETE